MPHSGSFFGSCCGHEPLAAQRLDREPVDAGLGDLGDGRLAGLGLHDVGRLRRPRLGALVGPLVDGRLDHRQRRRRRGHRRDGTHAGRPDSDRFACSCRMLHHLPVVDVGIVGASGFTGAELLRLCAQHPDLDVRVATGDTQAGSAVADLYPSLGGGLPRPGLHAYDAAAVDGLDLVFLGLPHGASQAIVPGAAGQGRPPRRPGGRLPAPGPGALPAVVRRGAHRARAAARTSPTGCPSSSATRSAAADHVATPGCYPTAAVLALAPLVRAGLVATDGIIVDAASGVSGAGRPPKPNTTFCTVDEDFTAYGLLDHRHTPEIEQVLGASVLFTPAPRADEPGHPRHLLRPADRADIHRRAARRCLRDAYADEPFVVVTDGSPSTKATLGSNCAHVTARYDERTGWVVAIAAIDNLTKGASGAAVQCANLLLDLPETTGLPIVGRVPVTRHGARRGSPRPAIACGIKASGDPDLSLVATDRRPAGRGRGRVHPEQDDRRAGRHHQRAPHAHRRSGGRRRAQQRLRQRRHRRAGRGRRPGDVRRRWPPSSAAPPTRCWSARPGSSATALPMDAILAGIPKLVAARSVDGGADAAEAMRTTDTHRKETLVRRRRLHRRRDGQGRRHAGARTWRRCSPCSPPTPPSSPPSSTDVAPRRRGRELQRHVGRRLHLHQRHRDPAGIRRGRCAGGSRGLPGGGGRGLPRPGQADGGRRRRAHQGRRGPGHRRALRRRCPRRGPQGGGEPAGEVLVVRPRPVLGPRRERARHGRHHLRAREADACATATSWWPKAG